MNTDEWKHVMSPSDCFAYNGSMKTSLFFKSFHDLPSGDAIYSNTCHMVAHATRSIIANIQTNIWCSHCLPGFTATVDDTGCMPNDECIRRLPCIWAAVLLSYLIYGLYVALSCLDSRSGITSSLLVFGQMSQFALPHLPCSTSSFSVTLTTASHFDSLASSYTNVCLGAQLSTFRLNLVKLWGPVSVLFFALFWTWVLKRHQRTTKSTSKSAHLERQISYFGTLAQCLLLIVSSLASAGFKLVQCIDLMASPTWYFWTALDFVTTTHGLRWCVWCDTSGSCSFLVCITLVVREVASIRSICGVQCVHRSGLLLASRHSCFSHVHEFGVSLRSVGQSSLLLISVMMTLLLIHLQPYVQSATYRVDLLCHVCLVVPQLLFL